MTESKLKAYNPSCAYGSKGCFASMKEVFWKIGTWWKRHEKEEK